jgi:hypothetical protein
MLTHYFSDPVMLDLIQQTPAAVYLDCLSAELVATGYKCTIGWTAPPTVGADCLASVDPNLFVR